MGRTIFLGVFMENKTKKPFKTTIGGQALIEGIMMRGPSQTSIAVRKPDGEIELKVEDNSTLSKRYKILNLPIIRGAYKLIEAMYIGINALTYSASFWESEDEVEDDSFLTKMFPNHGEDIEMALAILASFAIAIFFFMILPSWITSFAKAWTDNIIILNIIEGILRLIFFFIYLIGVSRIDEIERVFEYHGAEHKSIHCYENRDELIVENVKKYPRMHPRCGTSFLFMVLIISIIILSFFGWPNPLMRALIRILLFPVIAGVAYEVNRVIGKYDTGICKVLRYPGLEIQRLATVNEPDEQQMEVSITALKAVLPKEGEDDLWK